MKIRHDRATQIQLALSKASQVFHRVSEHLPPPCGTNHELQLSNIHFSTTGSEQLHTAHAQDRKRKTPPSDRGDPLVIREGENSNLLT